MTSHNMGNGVSTCDTKYEVRPEGIRKSLNLRQFSMILIHD